MKKHLTKVLIVLLCLVQIFLLAGCNKGNKTPTETTPPAVDSSQIGGVDENGYQRDDLGTMDFQNETIDILYWSDRSCQEFTSSGKDSDIVNNSIWDRNAKVEERLKVELNFIGRAGNYYNREEFSATVEKDVLNAREYDMYACYGPLASKFATAGYLSDMNTLDYLNFDQPWWPSNVVSNLSLGNKLYFATGDVSTNLLWMMQIILFNTNVKSTNEIEKDFYQMVQDGTWTLANFMEICAGVYNGKSGEQTLEDTYGLVIHANVFDSFVIGAGIKAIDKDENDLPAISSTYTSERMGNLVSTLGRFLNTDDVFKSKAGGGKNAFTDARQLFEEGKSLFIVDKLYIVQSGALKDMKDKYGLLPMPMYEAQTEYYTDIGQTHTQYCIADKGPDNSNMCAAVLECMASESYRQIIPVVYAKVMKVKYGVDSQTSEMYDLLRERITFDFGKIFQMVFSNDPDGGNSYTRELYINAIDKESDWNITLGGVKGAIEEKLLDITILLG